MSGRWKHGVWRCCGKSRGKTKFCSDCGTERPPASDAGELLAHFQVERDKAEHTKATFLAKARELRELAPDLSDVETKENGCLYGSPQREAILTAGQYERSAAGFGRRAAKYATWCSILSELMLIVQAEKTET